MLNSITVTTLIFSKVFNFNKFVYSILNISLISLVLYLPYSNTNVITNNIIKALTENNNLDSTLLLYIKFLDFVSYYEKVIS